MIYKAENLQKAVNYLRLRFPVAELSRELGYHRSSISNWLRGERPLSKQFVKAFEDKFKVKLSDFGDDTDIMPMPIDPDSQNLKEVSVWMAENQDRLLQDPLFRAVLRSMIMQIDSKKHS